MQQHLPRSAPLLALGDPKVNPDPDLSVPFAVVKPSLFSDIIRDDKSLSYVIYGFFSLLFPKITCSN